MMREVALAVGQVLALMRELVLRGSRAELRVDGSETVNSKCRLREKPIAQGLDSRFISRNQHSRDMCLFPVVSVHCAESVLHLDVLPHFLKFHE